MEHAVEPVSVYDILCADYDAHLCHVCVCVCVCRYIGNAPNFIIKAICEEQKVKMPNFGVFMVWSIVFLSPALLTVAEVYLV